MHGWIAALKVRLQVRLPVISRAVRIALDAEIIDRAAALALFCMLAAVPALFGTFSVLGFVIDKVDSVAGLAGYEVAHQPIIERLVRLVQEVLPGVTWDPSTLATSLIDHRAYNGALGTFAALTLGMGVFARIDASVRAVLGRKRRSAWRAAGMMTLFFFFMALLAMLLVVAAPITDWGLRATTVGVSKISSSWVQWLPLIVASGQTLPVSVGFFIMVRWSAGSQTLPKTKIAIAGGLFGLLWFLGQRAFSLYVLEIAAMNAVYGTLTGVVAFLLWLYYAAIAFLVVVSLLAAWTESRRAGNSDEQAPPLSPTNGHR